MYQLPEQPEFSKGYYKANNSNHVQHTTKLGVISKTNRIVSGRQRLEDIEATFMSISFKANRSDSQRAERRAKRL